MRGLEGRQEVNPSLLLRDTRPLLQKFMDTFTDPFNVAVILVTLGGGSFVLPVLSDLFFLIGIIIFAISLTRKHMLPFRMPKVANVKDYNDYKPGQNKPNVARGIAFLVMIAKATKNCGFIMKTCVPMY